jgi:zinc protease
VAGTLQFEQEYLRRASEVTAPQIRSLAGELFKPENLSAAVVSPSEKEPEVAKDLRRAVQAAHAEVRTNHKPAVREVDHVVKVTLPSGARLLVLPDHSVPLVAVRAVWSAGLRYETTRDNGVNNLLAALITRGTSTRTADQINEAVEGMAGSIGGFSGLNSFGLRVELLARHWEQGLEILADCVLDPAFKEEEVERERRQVLDDIRAQQDNLNVVALQLFARTFYHRHPYRMDPLGTAESVSSLTRERLVQYYGRHFQPSSMVLAVVGDVDLERVKERFIQLFGSAHRRGRRAVPALQEPPRTKPEDAIHLMNKKQAHLVVGYPGTHLFDKDRYAVEVLASLLSGQGGRLFLELRDRQGLAYQVGAYSQEGIEPGYFAVYIATSPEKIGAALQGI